ncbi:hypothetical protein CTAYLR_003266 [Chrysophaeum taylorii]|uniref:HP domain-containing protein n=1 Tax=Chrysophaeum taylorii TaxID=2483200 RepID=A0AAD7UC09_9STRA|nr:hypothetical protein CTAYLR_003266 [Chrysophaeum taylorii]
MPPKTASKEMVAANNAAAKGDFEGALKLLEALPDEERASPTGLNIKVISLQKLGRLDEAAEVWKAIAEGPTAPGGQVSERAAQNYKRIRLAQKQRQVNDANKLLNGPHGAEPEDFRKLAKSFEGIDLDEPCSDEIRFLVQHNSGICYLQAGDWLEAAHHLQAALDMHPGDKSMANLQHDVGEALRQAIALQDEETPAASRYASLKGVVESRAQMEDFEGALGRADALLDVATANGFSLFEPHYWRGFAHFKGGNVAEGAEDLTSCIEIAKDPGADLGNIQRSDVPQVLRTAINAIITAGEAALLERNEPEVAHPLFERAVEAIDGCPDIGASEASTREGAALNDAVALSQIGEWGKSKEVLEEQLAIGECDRGWLMLGAVFAEGLKLHERAKDAFERACGLAGQGKASGYAPDPDAWRAVPSAPSRPHAIADFDGLHNLGFSCYKVDCLYDARDAFQSALKVDPNNEKTKSALALILSLLAARERRLDADLDKLGKDARAGESAAADRDAALEALGTHPSSSSSSSSDHDAAAAPPVDAMDALEDRANVLAKKAANEGVDQDETVKEKLDALEDAKRKAKEAVDKCAKGQTDPLAEDVVARRANDEAAELRKAANAALEKARALERTDGDEGNKALREAKDLMEAAAAADERADAALDAAKTAHAAAQEALRDDAVKALEAAKRIADDADAAIEEAAEVKQKEAADAAERDSLHSRADAANKLVNNAAAVADDGGVASSPVALEALAVAKDLEDSARKAIDLAAKGLISNGDAEKAVKKLEDATAPLEAAINDEVARRAREKAEREALRKRADAADDAGTRAKLLAAANSVDGSPDVAAALSKLQKLQKAADDALASDDDDEFGGNSNEAAAAAVAALEEAVPAIQEVVNSRLAAEAKKKAELDALGKRLENAASADEAGNAKARALELADAPDVQEALAKVSNLRKLAAARVADLAGGGGGKCSYGEAAAAVARAESEANELDAIIANRAAEEARKKAESEARKKAEEAKKKREKAERDALEERGKKALAAVEAAKRDAEVDDPTLLDDDDVAAARREAGRLRKLAERALADAAAGKISNVAAAAAVQAAEDAARAFRDALNLARLRRERERERRALRKVVDRSAEKIDGAPKWARQRNFVNAKEYPRDVVEAADELKREALAKLEFAESNPDDVGALEAAKAAVAKAAQAAKDVDKALDDAERAYRSRRKKDADAKEAELRRRLEEEEAAARRKAQSFYDHINRKNMAAMGLGDLVDRTKPANASTTPPPPAVSQQQYDPELVVPYKDLVKGPNFPAGVDPKNRENHLSQAEFEKIFGCDKEKFRKLPGWKRATLKKKAKLF